MAEDSLLLLPKEEEQFKLYKWRWVVLAIFSLISMSNEVVWISLSSITSIVKKYYGVDVVAVNWLALIFSVCYILCVVPVSYLLDKYGVKFTITAGATLNALGSCLRAIGATRNGFVAVFLGTTLAALAQCFILSLPAQLSFEWFGDSERATAVSIGVLMNVLGIAVGFLQGTMVPGGPGNNGDMEKGMHELLISQAVFCSFLAATSFFLVKKQPPTPPSRSRELVLKATRQDFIEKDLNNEDGDPGVSHTLDAVGVSSTSAGLQIAETSLSAENKTEDREKPMVEIPHVPSFGESMLTLVKDVQFHLISQAYSISAGQLIVYSTLLNQMVISKFPSKEKLIGYMGFASGVCSLFGILIGGVILDKTRHYKRLGISALAACASLMLLFSLLLEYYHNFVVIFVNFCAFGLFSQSYLPIALQHLAEITYPVPEGTTSGVFFLLANLYGMILTSLFSLMMRKLGDNVGGYAIAVCFAFSSILVSVVSAPLKRSQADGKVRT